MILKTIQPISILDRINNSEPITYSESNTEKEYEQWFFFEAYEWIKSNKMQKVGVISPTNQIFWAWEYATKKNIALADEMMKYQLENFRGQAAILTIEKPDIDILLSDHNLWEYVINYWAIPGSSKERKKWTRLEYKGVNFYETKPLPEEYHKLLEKTWDKVFQLKLNSNEEYVFDLPKKTLDTIGIKKEDCLLQATFWDIKKSEIISISKS